MGYLKGGMADHPIKSFWNELQRRKVVRLAVVYVIVAWVAVEVSSVMFPALLLPDWAPRLVVALALVGFPVALGLAWALQVTPEGVKPESPFAANEEDHREPAVPAAQGEERLDGWKRIAAYLNRDVRTVRRWEKHQGLPVRRLMHEKQATVYAYHSELDDWLQQQHEKSTAPAPARRLSGMPGPYWAWLAVPLLVMAALGAWFWPDTEQPPITFGEWDWVLVTEFDNRTGEDILDGTVEYALQRELANSRYVKVVPTDRVGDTLRLMQLPPDSPIDIRTGREISLRDGGIKFLVGGRTEKIGTRYSISADLVNPSDGVTLASFSKDAVGHDEILPAVGELARSVRSALGEGLSSIEGNKETLAKVTTPSLEALRLFSQANLLMATPERVRALAILEEAVRLDPDFASAHLLLHYALQEREQYERAAHHLERAVALAEGTTERERLFILAKYYDYLGDAEKEIETYRLLLRFYPDHYWANGNLSSILESLGQFEEAERLKVRLAELRPNSASWNPDLDIVWLATVNGHPEVRDKYVARLESVVEMPGYEWLPPFLILLPVHEAWIKAEYESALEQLEGIVAGMDEEALLVDGWLFAHIRSVYLALGRLDQFRQLTARREALGWFEAVLDYESGNRETLDRYLRDDSRAGFWEAALVALAGRPERAREIAGNPELLRTAVPIMSGPAFKSLALGQAAFAEGRHESVVSMHDRVAFLNVAQKWAYLFWMHTLAQAHEQLGDVGAAIETLESAALQKPLTIFETAGTFFWQRNQLYLHELYLRNGRVADAQRVEAELRDMLRLADADHPFLVELDRRRLDTASTE